MIDQKLIEMLRCPIDGNRLEMAENALLQRLNDAIGRGDLRDRMDQKITQSLDAALINRESNRGFPVRGGIPSLVADESFELPTE
ncbi:MAG: Trm112 family protein [Rubripirellula sp.]